MPTTKHVLRNNNGDIIEERWVDENGKFHSEDGQPSSIKYHNGLITGEFWYNHGKSHRDNAADGTPQPSFIGYRFGTKYSEVYFTNGIAHRDGSRIQDYILENGNIVTLSDPVLPQRVDYYDEIDKISSEMWYNNDNLLQKTHVYDKQGVLLQIIVPNIIY